MPSPPPRQTRPDIVHSSIYVPKAASLARECKVHDLVAIEPQIERGHGGLKTCGLGPPGAFLDGGRAGFAQSGSATGTRVSLETVVAAGGSLLLGGAKVL